MLLMNETSKDLFLCNKPHYNPSKCALIRAEVTSSFIIHENITMSSEIYSVAGNLAWENKKTHISNYERHCKNPVAVYFLSTCKVLHYRLKQHKHITV